MRKSICGKSYRRKILTGGAVLLASVLLLAACTGSGEQGTEPATAEVTGAGTPELRIDGTDISEFTIIYAKSPVSGYPEVVASAITSGVAEYEQEKRIAEMLRGQIEAKYGCALSVLCDADTPKTAHEILVGDTNRTQSAAGNALKTNEYCLKVKDGKLAICGGSYAATAQAAGKFAALSESDLPDGFGQKGTGNVLRIACIGDSLTAGSHAIPDKYKQDLGTDVFNNYIRFQLGYPNTLGRMLWTEAWVRNYGRGGASAINREPAGGGFPIYTQTESRYNECLRDNKSNPFDLFIIMLGTNDAKYLTTAQAQAEYRAEIRKIFDQLLADAPDARFLLMNCPTTFDQSKTTQENYARTRKIQAEAAKEFFDLGYDVSFYDMASYTAANFTVEMFNHCNTTEDYTHPDQTGYQFMALGVADAVRALYGGDACEYLTVYEK